MKIQSFEKSWVPVPLLTSYYIKLFAVWEIIATFVASINDESIREDMKTKHVQYETRGTCSKLIDVTADEHDIIQQVFFLGGCNGNLQGIGQLVRGQKIDDVIPRLNGIRCGTKGTSCPDQLCRALEQLKEAPVVEG